MVLAQSLLWAVLAACSVSAAPLIDTKFDKTGISLAIAAKLNVTGAANIIEADRQRAAKLMKGHFGKRQSQGVQVSNTAVTYTATVNIGSPPTAYNLLIDTGSSNTWIGADKTYNPTSTGHDTGKTVSVTYGGGSFSGEEWIDQVDLGNGLVINSQSIGVASKSQSFGNGIDGILGVGPTDLTSGSLDGSSETIPTVTDSLASQGTTGNAILGMFYAPYIENVPGTLTFGDADDTLYVGELGYVPLTTTYPASDYWGIDQSVAYGGSTILSSTAGIVDSGTTMVLLATDAFNAYVQATGAVKDSNSGFMKISKSQYSSLKPLTFNIGEGTYTLTPNGQIWPRALNSALGGDDDDVFLVVADLGSPSGQGFDFINGYFWMERFYTVFDSESKRVGVANTVYTYSQDN